jgi:hypothetical protein
MLIKYEQEQKRQTINDSASVGIAASSFDEIVHRVRLDINTAYRIVLSYISIIVTTFHILSSTHLAHSINSAAEMYMGGSQSSKYSVIQVVPATISC